MLAELSAQEDQEKKKKKTENSKQKRKKKKKKLTQVNNEEINDNKMDKNKLNPVQGGTVV